MAKQYSNSAKSRSYGGNGGSISQGANLETLRYQNQAALRNSHDNDAEFFNDIGNAVIGPSGRPRGIGANLAYGVSKGLAHGAKSSSTEERKENYDKYANVMNYLQEVNNASLEQNQWYETRENARKEMLPQVLSYIDNIDRLDPQSQRIMAQDMLAQYGNAVGEDYKLSSIDGSNPFLMTIQGSKGQQLFDLRSLFAGDDANQQAIAMKMPAYQMKLQEERTNKQREFDQRQDALDIRKFEKGIPGGKYGVNNSPQSETPLDNNFEYGGIQYETVPLNGLQKGEITDYGKAVNKAVTQIPTNENSIKAIHKMREVFEKFPNIGESWINMLNNGDDEETWGKWISKKINSREERAAMEILKKESSDLNLSTVLSIPGKSATDLLKRAIQSSSPTGTLTKQAFDTVANEWEERAINNIDMARAQAQARSQGRMIVSKSRNLPAQSTESPLASLGKRVG